MGHPASISPLLSACRRYIRNDRQARRARRDLAAELGHYSSQGDRAELGAIMDRHTPEETAEMRDILQRMSS
jgi:hypothetical protein